MERAHAGAVDKAGVAINMGLHVLTRVIGALAERGARHIPWRDSALTRLMQSSLGVGCLPACLPART